MRPPLGQSRSSRGSTPRRKPRPRTRWGRRFGSSCDSTAHMAISPSQVTNRDVIRDGPPVRGSLLPDPQQLLGLGAEPTQFFIRPFVLLHHLNSPVIPGAALVLVAQ